LRNVPRFRTSAGAEAIELAEVAGLTCDPWQCDVLVDSLGETGKGAWAAFEVAVVVGRQNGKGSILEARVLAGLNLFDEKLILWSAHETKTAFEAFRRVEELFTNVDALRRQVKKVSHANGDEGIELRNGARLRFVARTKGSGRGFSADLVILDEAYALTDDQISALLPTLSSRANPQIWYTSSPPLDGITGDQLYRLRKRAQAGDPALAYFDWGVQGVDLADLGELDAAGKLLVDLDDRKLWKTTNPSYGVVRSNGSRGITEGFVERERGTMSPVDFARERLGIWPRKIEGGSGVVDLDHWRTLGDAFAERPRDVVFAADVNPARTHGVIAACGFVDGRAQVAIVDYRPGTHWIVERLATLCKTWDPLAVAIDVKGPVGSLLLDLAEAGIEPPEDRERPGRGTLIVPTAGETAQAFGLFVDAVRDSTMRHADDGPLNLAISGAAVRPLAGGSAWDRKAGADISPLVAATLAHWALHVRSVPDDSQTYDLLSSIY
jgi:hypothetical protein